MAAENVQLMRRAYARWEQGDFATAEFFDPAVEYVRIGGEGVGAGGTSRGIDEMWASIADWFRAWESFRVKALRYFEVDGGVLVVARLSARGRRSGVSIEREVGHLFTIRDEKVVRWEDFANPEEALRAVGLAHS